MSLANLVPKSHSRSRGVVKRPTFICNPKFSGYSIGLNVIPRSTVSPWIVPVKKSCRPHFVVARAITASCRSQRTDKSKMRRKFKPCTKQFKPAVGNSVSSLLSRPPTMWRIQLNAYQEVCFANTTNWREKRQSGQQQ
jgi:hypothetical protein